METIVFSSQTVPLISPLAGETTWMETFRRSLPRDPGHKRSPLAGETTWMETSVATINFPASVFVSPLAGETTWMETQIVADQ